MQALLVLQGPVAFLGVVDAETTAGGGRKGGDFSCGRSATSVGLAHQRRASLSLDGPVPLNRPVTSRGATVSRPRHGTARKIGLLTASYAIVASRLLAPRVVFSMRDIACAAENARWRGSQDKYQGADDIAHFFQWYFRVRLFGSVLRLGSPRSWLF